MFCDLLAQTPLNLERNVSLERVREFKLTTRDGLGQIVPAVRAALPGLTEQDGVDLVAAATSLARDIPSDRHPGARGRSPLPVGSAALTRPGRRRAAAGPDPRVDAARAAEIGQPRAGVRKDPWRRP
ncbi:hypothetical protein [Promicromonospora panici]|uniref:hypothetical protein n=1 Tax=Promicromonospora panici TaxID=2219658 RepID=UPI001F5C0D4A|nr:hypothetical protein [Promicromonospora panici]